MTMDIIICLSASAMAGYTDWKNRKVKNALVFPVLLGALLWNLTTGGHLALVDSLSAGALPLILFPFYAIRMLGAGDIKLLMALGAWLGLRDCASLMVLSILCGGAIALGIILVNRNGVIRLQKLWVYMKACAFSRKLLPYQDFRQMEKGSALPFALAVFGGVILLLGQRIGIIPQVI